MSEKKYNNHQLNGDASKQDEDFIDRKIFCIDCRIEFIWTIGEQTFFRDKGLQNPPKRCRNCKEAKNKRIAAVAAARETGIRQRIEVAINCAKCKSYTTVPFFPSQGRPVLCRSCFLELNAKHQTANGEQ